MHVFDWISRLFTHVDEEERMIREIEEETAKDITEARETNYPATVITYLPDPNNENIPVMNVVVDNFKAVMLPELGSIIWANINDILRPFRVIRFDFISNGSEYDSMRIYIVVEPATYSDVVPNPRFNI